jgi:hypothetical protein
MTPFDQLLRQAGPPLRGTPPASPSAWDAPPRLAAELARLLGARNGFYALDDALHVFPSGTAAPHIDVEAWNAPTLWRNEYDPDMVEGLFFFAEDVFGHQFTLSSDGIQLFDPETGDLEPFAASVEEWCAALVDDPDASVVAHVARAWREARGALRPGQRLVPTKPFVIGGTNELENLYELDAVAGMRVRGSIARQIRNLPEGTDVVLTTR